MFFGFDLKEIFLFPVKDADARKHFLIGSLISLAGFIIPIVPYLVLYGYAVLIVRQIFRNESPRMIPWEDWGGLLKDGAKLFGIRMLFAMPVLILALPIFLSAIGMPIFMANASESEMNTLFGIFTVIMLGSFCILVPLSIPLAVLIPAAEMYMIEQDDFSAAFRFREWWKVLRANLGGFIAAFAIYYFATIILTFAIQLLMATLIFACLLPILLPALTIYIVLLMYTTFAIAYRDGKTKLAQLEGQFTTA
jgi:hypothetical protein